MRTASHTMKSLCLISIAFFFNCAINLSDNGSGTNVGNSTIIGIIHDQNGNPVSSTRVLLLSVDHNPIVNPVIGNNHIDTTDIRGNYRFTNAAAGQYNIEAEHGESNTKLLIRNLDVPINATIAVPAEMLKKTGALRVGLQSSMTDGYLFIRGTTIKQQLRSNHTANDTVIFHSIPAGKMPDIQHIPLANVNNPTVIATEVTVTPDDTIDITTTGTFTITGILLKEPFDDSNLAANGWYDDVNPILSKTEYINGSISSLEYTFLAGDTAPLGGAVMRRLFTETDSVYVGFWVKYGKNWQGSLKHSGESAIALLTNKDDPWAGPWYNFFSAHTQQDSGKPVVYINDAKNIDEANIGNDLTGVTESRAVAGCNGDCDGYGPGECYPGTLNHSNYKSFKKENAYFQDNPGKYYKNDWHHIELFLKLNSISNNKGIADGVIKYWYDSELVMNLNHVMFRTAAHPDMKFNQIIMAPNIGVSPVDQTMWIDELTIAQ